MELLNNLELVDVVFEGQKATLVFLHEDRGEIREVNFNKQSFDAASSKFIDDPEKAEKVDKWCEEYFGLPFERLAEAIGERKDVHAYDNFNSLFEVAMVSKFDDDMVGQIFEADIKEVIDDGKKIAIRFEYEGNTYESKMTYADYLESRKEWFVNPQKKDKQFKKFEEKFLVPVSQKDELVGKTIMVEVKKAMGKWVYSEIKPFRKPKK
jgi:hypothetical protein